MVELPRQHSKNAPRHKPCDTLERQKIIRKNCDADFIAFFAACGELSFFLILPLGGKSPYVGLSQQCSKAAIGWQPT